MTCDHVQIIEQQWLEILWRLEYKNNLRKNVKKLAQTYTETSFGEISMTDASWSLRKKRTHKARNFPKKLHENAHFIRCLRVVQLIFLFGFCKSETEEAATECALERNLFLKIFRKIQR